MRPGWLPKGDPAQAALRWSSRLGTKDPMAPSTRHLYPQWLRPGNARRPLPSGGRRTASSTGRGGSGSGCGPSTVVTPPASTSRSPSCCSSCARAGSSTRARINHPKPVARGGPNRPAGLPPPGAHGRLPRDRVVAFVQWFVTGPVLADAALLVAVYTVAVESEWVLVVAAWVILEAGVIMATVRWTPTGSDLKSLRLPDRPGLRRPAGRRGRARAAQPARLAGRTGRTPGAERDQQAIALGGGERARIAGEMHDVVSHNIQVMVTLADAAAAAQASDPGGPRTRCTRYRARGVRHCTTCDACSACCASGPAGDGGALRRPGASARPCHPSPGSDDLDALVERVRGTGLDVVGRALRPALRRLAAPLA